MTRQAVEMITDERLAQVFVQLADTLVADFDAVDFLQTLSEAIVELLDVQSAGLMLADRHGELRPVASTSAAAAALELLELEHDEGPCAECFASGDQVVNVGRERALSRWPRLMAAAADAGVASVHALPLRLRGQVIGAMDLFCANRLALADVEIAVGQALADVATIGLLQERVVRQKTVLAEQLQTALNSRILIEQAKGVLAERAGWGIAESFTAIRGYARRHRRPLVDVATHIIDGTLNTPDLAPCP